MNTRRLYRPLVALCMLGGIALAVPNHAEAAPLHGTAVGATCTGTSASPGVLAGTYSSSVVISGYCVVDGGPTTVNGSITVATGATLDATFARNDVTGIGTSSLHVTGGVKVTSGAVFAMGCEPNYAPCSDDPAGTLTGTNTVGMNITGAGALGLVVHASTIGGSINLSHGGGGSTCTVPTSGYFAKNFSPVFSDFEDNSIGGNLHVIGVQSCWLGLIRNAVHKSLTDSNNTFADPDANETMNNTVGKNITCSANTPAVHVGDSSQTPNLVKGTASGECSFSSVSAGVFISMKV